MRVQEPIERPQNSSTVQCLIGEVSQNHPPYPHDHNGGPPLEDSDEHVPEWGSSGIRTYFAWKRAYEQIWKSVPHAIALRRLRNARACGLTYEEYTLYLLDTGRYLQPSDHEAIAIIMARREGP